jgi:hypothetical protein
MTLHQNRTRGFGYSVSLTLSGNGLANLDGSHAERVSDTCHDSIALAGAI